MPLHGPGTRLPRTVLNSQAVVNNIRVQALSDLGFNIGRQTTNQQASVNSRRADLYKQIFHVAGCDSPSVSILHGPKSTEHDFAKLLTIAQSWQAAVEGVPMQQRNTNGPDIHNRISCSPPALNQKHEHESQNILDVNGTSRLPSRSVAWSQEKPTVEDKRTPVVQKVHQCSTYCTLQSIDRRPTVIGSNL